MAEILMRWKAAFWSKVEIGEEDECWNWNPAPSPGHYGSARLNGKSIGSNKMAYILEYGDIPKGMQVCHTCDNRRCCNPKHLFLGTNEDNIRDMLSKGRQADPKLTEDKVRTIRKTYAEGSVNQRELAEMHGVTILTINQVILRKCWKWVED